MVVRAYIRVCGRVQGVGFRYFVLHHARRLGIKGYVRNNPDGSVEAVVEGTPAAVEELISLIRIGPRAARIERVDVQWREAVGEFTGFEIR